MVGKEVMDWKIFLIARLLYIVKLNRLAEAIVGTKSAEGSMD